METTKVILDENEIPKNPLEPPFNPQTKEPITPDDLHVIFPMELIKQEVSRERYVVIPDKVRESLQTMETNPSLQSETVRESS